MRDITLNGVHLTVAESLEELSARAFNMYNKYLLIDAGIGGDIEALDAHLVRVLTFIEKDPQKAMLEIQNIRENVFLINTGVNPKHMAFCALILKIKGEAVINYTETGIKETLSKIQDISHVSIDQLLQDLKKKISGEITLFFKVTNLVEQEAVSLILSRVKVILEGVITSDVVTDKIKTLDYSLMLLNPPKSFSGDTSVEIAHIKDFESTVLFIQTETNTSVESMNALQYLNAIEFLRKKYKK